MRVRVCGGPPICWSMCGGSMRLIWLTSMCMLGILPPFRFFGIFIPLIAPVIRDVHVNPSHCPLLRTRTSHAVRENTTLAGQPQCDATGKAGPAAMLQSGWPTVFEPSCKLLRDRPRRMATGVPRARTLEHLGEAFVLLQQHLHLDHRVPRPSRNPHHPRRLLHTKVVRPHCHADASSLQFGSQNSTRQ